MLHLDTFGYDVAETCENFELLEEGVLLEHFVLEEPPITQLDESAELYGNFAEDIKVWSLAENELSDSVMCEKYILEALTGDQITAEDIISRLEASGSFDYEYGCTQYGVGSFLEELGFSVIRESSTTVNDLCESLDNNEKIICALSSIALNYPELSDMPSLSADKYVEVIGIDRTNPLQVTVILNDPLSEGGAEIPLDRFSAAWNIGGRYSITVRNIGTE